MILGLTSGEFTGGRAGSAPPPFERRTDAVTVLVISENGHVLWRVELHFNRFAVKLTCTSEGVADNARPENDGQRKLGVWKMRD